MDKIVILMATYQGENYLEEQLDSIVAQDYPYWELMVCDDGSTDRTMEILQANKCAPPLFRAPFPFLPPLLKASGNFLCRQGFLCSGRQLSSRHIASDTPAGFPTILCRTISCYPALRMHRILIRGKSVRWNLETVNRIMKARMKSSMMGV